jgi:hypothetical protein
VLIVLVATLVAVFVALGTMPGRIARKRGHPWPEAVTVGSWATLARRKTGSAFPHDALALIGMTVSAPAQNGSSRTDPAECCEPASLARAGPCEACQSSLAALISMILRSGSRM